MVEQAPIVMEVPDIRDYARAIAVELVSAEGERLAANFVNILVKGEDVSPAG